MTDTRTLALEHGLNVQEYESILEALGREPTYTELGILSVMWSEHCSYKSSRVHLRKLYTDAPWVVVGPGENAGAIDIGEEHVVVFKMESHNHPSYIEPFQGAATGVGGIMRDVFTMGARPIANLNSLRFGRPDHPRTKYLINGVVSGIAHYGNCMGVPTVGGEVYFDSCYDGNILVNAFTLGVCRRDAIFKGVATGVGNPIFYVGAGTGRDGIHGATMASEQFAEGDEEKRPTVQVGDPFREKLLLEACLELMATDAIIGIQDMGAAGLTSSSVEMADRGNAGIEIDIDCVPMREENMTAYEAMLSESQERMLMVVRPGEEQNVADIFDKWDLHWAKIGVVTDTNRIVVKRHGDVMADLPIAVLTSAAPVYDRPTQRPAYIGALSPIAWDDAIDLNETLSMLVSSENICSRRAVFEQYDHMVGTATLVGPGQADAAVMRVHGTNRVIALSVDCSSRKCFIDPREGAKHAVAEVTRNISCTGAVPRGATDCLNFGDPTNPEIMWQFVEAIEGLSDACEFMELPIVGGNVSLYNASDGKDIYPTPGLAAVGVFEEDIDTIKIGTSEFKNAGDFIAVLGETNSRDFGASEVAHILGLGVGSTLPTVDLEIERNLQRTIRALIKSGAVNSAHDCSEGGLAVTLVECLFGTQYGAELSNEQGAAFWFSESPSRIVVSFSAEQRESLESLIDLPLTMLGSVSIDDRRLLNGSGFDLDLDVLEEKFESKLRHLRS